MRIIAYYLPQFHQIKENDEWWGEGFTEWVNVKKAKPLFRGHYQPRVPINNNYYDLLSDDIKIWQVNLANEYGIYGFCFYHYWFNGHMLLEKPVEQFLKNKDLDINFCLSWANEPWTKAWVSKKDNVLIDQSYGEKKEWEQHFYYLLPFFLDDRYIKTNGKPLFVIYRPEQIECLNKMLDYWQKLAKQNGLPGIDFAYQHLSFDLTKDKDDSRFTYNIEYEPGYASFDMRTKTDNYMYRVLKDIDEWFLKHLNHQPSNFFIRKVRTANYEDVWKACVNHKPQNEKSIAGAFVDWDNTPRRGSKGIVYKGATPTVFKKYFKQKIKKVKELYSTDMIFIFAWNEWAEGGYLEPDEKFGYSYLEAIKECLIECYEDFEV